MNEDEQLMENYFESIKDNIDYKYFLKALKKETDIPVGMERFLRGAWGMGYQAALSDLKELTE